MNHEAADALAGGPKRRMPSLWPPLVLVVMAVIGNAIIMHSGVERSMSFIMPVVILNQVFSAALWVGAGWLGILLAYRAIMQARGCWGCRA